MNQLYLWINSSRFRRHRKTKMRNQTLILFVFLFTLPNYNNHCRLALQLQFSCWTILLCKILFEITILHSPYMGYKRSLGGLSNPSLPKKWVQSPDILTYPIPRVTGSLAPNITKNRNRRMVIKNMKWSSLMELVVFRRVCKQVRCHLDAPKSCQVAMEIQMSFGNRWPTLTGNSELGK